MSGHWDDHDVVRMARRVRDVELALDARRQELEWVVSERDSLRSRVAELEEIRPHWKFKVCSTHNLYAEDPDQKCPWCRIAELERELETSRALATTNAHTHHEVRHLYAEMNRQGARLAAWEQVVRAVYNPVLEKDRLLWAARVLIAAREMPPEHRPEVEP